MTLPSMLRTARVISMGLVIALVGMLASDVVTGTGGFAAGRGHLTYVYGTAEQRAQVNRVLGYFGEAGIDMPPIVLVTYRPFEWCPDRIKGRASASPFGGEVDICLHTDRALAHELAHLYLYTAMTPQDREDFATRRALPTWNSREWDWEERATEHAANLIVWWAVDRARGDYVYWKIRSENPRQDLADLVWLLDLHDSDNGDPGTNPYAELHDPTVELLATAGPVPRQLGRRSVDPLHR